MNRTFSSLRAEVQGLIEPGMTSRVEEMLRGTVQFDDYGLVRPARHLDALRQVVVENLTEARLRMQTMMLAGKTVIYIPGAFDLVHIGHASYVAEAISHVLRACCLNREQLYVVMLADSDDLIAAAKPASRYAANGEHPRPIESSKLYQHVLWRKSAFNPRAIDLAQLDVDMVGLLPSPSEAHELIGNWDFRHWFNQTGRFEGTAVRMLAGAGDDVAVETTKTLAEYDLLASALAENRLDKVITSFDCSMYGLPHPDTECCWTLPSWQLLLHRYLGMVQKRPEAGCYRILSMHDSYSPVVARLMELSTISTVKIDDAVLLSTTKLLNACGWPLLYSAKVSSFENWVTS